MSWWQKRTTQAQHVEQSLSNFPVQFELIPSKLSAQVHLQNIDTRDSNIPCWTYITHGLQAHKQKEIIFSLRRGIQQKVDEFPQEPLRFFMDVYHYAETGRLVDVGDISEMRPTSFLNQTGLLYIHPEPAQKNLARLDDALTAVLLTEEEIAAVKQFGSMRVMTRLGQAYWHYPCPPWSDRNRPSLSFARSMQESVLAKFPRAWIKGIRVGAKGNDVVMHVLPKVSAELRGFPDYLPMDTPIVFFTDFDLSADGCLAWEPGQSQPVMIAPPTSRNSYLCGCFILFLPNQPENAVKLIEDGWGIVLTNASWQAVRQALLTGKPISIPSTEKGAGFKLEWIQTSYQSPIDGTVYHTEGGWEKHTPEEQVNATNVYEGPVRPKQVVLLTSDNDLRDRIGLEPLSAYIQAIQKTVQDHFISFPVKNNQGLMTQFEVWPGGKAEVKMASRPGIDDNILQPLYTALVALTVPKVNHESIKFQIEFLISGSES